MGNQSTEKNMSLMERLSKSGATKNASVLSDSVFFNEKDMIPTEVPIINLALSGRLDGGITSGLNIIAGESKRFKSLLGLLQVKAYLRQYEDAVCLFYDSEFGIPPDYISSMGIDPARVLHIPIEHIEQLKFDISKRLEEIKRGDKVIIFVDSLGNLASKKEVEDALDEKSVSDMTRAKQVKSLFRIITPHLTTKDVTCIVINHVYKEQGLFPKDIVSGGQGVMLSANNVWIIGKSQEKVGTDIVGWNFTINIEKSRFVKEKSKFPFLVTYEGGLQRYSGLLDIALESGHVVKPSNGWYCRKGEEAKVRESATGTKEFWKPILDDETFREFCKDKYQLSSRMMYNSEYEDE